MLIEHLLFSFVILLLIFSFYTAIVKTSIVEDMKSYNTNHDNLLIKLIDKIGLLGVGIIYGFASLIFSFFLGVVIFNWLLSQESANQTFLVKIMINIFLPITIVPSVILCSRLKIDKDFIVGLFTCFISIGTFAGQMLDYTIDKNLFNQPIAMTWFGLFFECLVFCLLAFIIIFYLPRNIEKQ